MIDGPLGIARSMLVMDTVVPPYKDTCGPMDARHQGSVTNVDLQGFTVPPGLVRRLAAFLDERMRAFDVEVGARIGRIPHVEDADATLTGLPGDREDERRGRVGREAGPPAEELPFIPSAGDGSTPLRRTTVRGAITER